MDVIRMLILEDDAGQREIWSDNVDSFNEEHEASGPKIDVVLVDNASDARAQLATGGFDCMVSDLRVPEGKDGEPQKQSSNSAIDFLFANAPCPVAIFSGFHGDFAPPAPDWPAKAFERSSDAFREVLDWFKGKRELMAVVRSTRDKMGTLTAALFHRSLWRRWESDTRAVSVEGFVRQLAGHIGEELAVSGTNASALAGEHYFDPPLRGRLHTGDLVRDGDTINVVLSPQCDMVREYPEHILLAVCEPVDPNKAPWKEVMGEGALSKSASEDLDKHLRQNAGDRKHFLPPLRGEGPWHVRFDRTSTVPRSEVDQLLSKRFASITPAFVPNLTYRFASFLGRPGQPALDAVSTRRECQKRPDGITARPVQQDVGEDSIKSAGTAKSS